MIRPETWPWENDAATHGVHVDPVANHPHRPIPDPVSGHLVADPDIVLKARGFDLQINFFYSTGSTPTGITWGKRRSASINAQLKDEGGGVALIRGDGKVYRFTGTWTPLVVTTMTAVDAYYSGTQLVWDGAKFVETFADGKTITYDQSLGNGYVGVSEVADPSGNTHTYAYTGNQIESIEVPGGNRVTLSYDVDGHVESIEDWGGRRWTMTYDGNDQMLSMQIPTGCQTQYNYPSTNGLVDAITDPRGYTTSYTFYGDGRVETMALGTAVWTYLYEAGGATIGPKGGSEVVSPTGAITTYLLDTGMVTSQKIAPEGYTVTYAYDAQFNKVLETMPYGNVQELTYNAFGQPLTSTDPLGNVTTFNYDVSNNLVSLQNALGEVTTMAYDGQRRMTSRMDALGRTQSWEWNTNGTLKASVDGRGLRTTHAYDAVGNIVSTMYSDNSVVTYGYDTLNRRITVKDPLGRVTTTAYDAADHVVSIMNAAGEVNTFIYDTCLLQAQVNPLGYRTSYTYERYGKVRTVMNALGQVTTTNYDTMGYPVSMQNALGYVTTMVYNAAKQRVAVQDANGIRATTSYDAGGRPVSFINGAGIVTTTVYDARGPVAHEDALGRRTTMIFDALGRQTATQSPMNFRTSTIYDAAGQVRATQDALGYLTTNSYDLAGNLVTVIDARGYVSAQIYASNTNRLVASQDATGARTTYSYDAAGQVVTTMNARGYITTTTYDLAGRVSEVRDALGYRTTYSYDAAGQNTAVKNARNNTFTTIYDALGRVEATQTPLNIRTTNIYDAAGQQTATQDGDGHRWTTIYDPGGRVSATQTPLNNRTTTTYDGANRPYEVKNARNYVTSTLYDAANRVVSVMNALGHVKQYGYDADGRNVTITNPAGGVITMSYDNAGQMLTIGTELNQKTSYTYDQTGNVATRKFAGGDVTTYTYDQVGRETKKEYVDGTTVTFVYDTVGNLTTMMDSLGTATYTYDAVNQTLLEVDEIGKKQAFTYDAVGNRTGLTFTEISQAYSWAYDNDNRQNQVIDPLDNEVNTQFNARGLKTTVTYQGGRDQVFSYDNAGRNTVIANNDVAKTNLFTYTYDDNSNVYTWKDGGNVATYTYDGADRLTADTTTGPNAHTYAYSYDSRGNILTNNETGATVTHTYDAASRLATSVEGAVLTTYIYDINGNPTQIDKGATYASMAYDFENQMNYHEDETGDATYYSYDPFMHLKQDIRIVDTNRWYVWMDDMIVRMHDTGAGVRASTFNDGTIVGEIDNLTVSPATKYYLADLLGSVVGITTPASFTVTDSRRVSPYGRVLAGAAVTAHNPAWVGGFGYHPTGLAWAEYMAWHRFVSTRTSQWTTRDLLWPEEWGYAYVNGNPTTSMDPTGLSTLKGCCTKRRQPSHGPHGEPIVPMGPPDYWDNQSAICSAMKAAVCKCGISENVLCDILDSGCEQVAREYGVDPTILCALLVAENGGEEGTGSWKAKCEEWYWRCVPNIDSPDWNPFEKRAKRWSLGCGAIQPRHAKSCIDRLKKCNKSLYNKLLPLPSHFPIGWAKKLNTDCTWSIRVAAACMYVETTPACGGKSRPIDFPKTWNPGRFPKAGWPDNTGSDYYPKRVKCVMAAFHKHNPFRSW